MLARSIRAVACQARAFATVSSMMTTTTVNTASVARMPFRSIHTSKTSFSAGISQHRDTPDNTADMKWDFTEENYKKVKYILSKFPTNYKSSACMPLLTLAQEQNNNWLPLAAMNKVAQICEMAPIRVYEVASFYTMYNREPLGKYHLQVCGTTPCQLCGAENIIATVEKHLGIKCGETTKDKMFTLSEVECLGACANAPMMQVNNHEFYENLTSESTIALLDNMRAGKPVKVGPQNGQRVAEGPQGKTSLFEGFTPTKVRDIDALLKEEAEKAKAAAAAAAAAAAQKK